MTQYRSTRQPPRRAQQHSSLRFLVTTLITTTMVATGGFGALPDNPVTQQLQEEIGQNVPESVLNPVNSYLEQLSVPTIQPLPTSTPNSSLDLVGLILDAITPQPTAAESGIEDQTSTPSETATEVGTQTVTDTPSTDTVTPTITATRTLTPTSTFTPTATATPTANCSRVSTVPANTTFFNSSQQTINVYWVDSACKLVLSFTLGPSQSLIQPTYIGDRWWFINSSSGHLIADYVVASVNDVVDVSTGAIASATSTPTPTPTSAPTTTTATAVPSTGFNVSAVSLDGSGSVVTVSPGQPVSVTYNYQVYSGGCTTCITQLVTGLGFSGSQSESCAYNGIPGAPPGDSGSENTVLLAPEVSGTYNVIVEFHWQFTCADALLNYGVGPAIAPQIIGQIVVP